MNYICYRVASFNWWTLHLFVMDIFFFIYMLTRLVSYIITLNEVSIDLILVLENRFEGSTVQLVVNITDGNQSDKDQERESVNPWRKKYHLLF